MKRYVLSALLMVSVAGLGLVSAGATPRAQAAKGNSAAVHQKLINFRLANEVSVQGSGFTPATDVTVTLFSTTNGSISTISPVKTFKSDSRGKLDTEVLITAACPDVPGKTYHANVGGTVTSVAPSAC